MTAWGLASTPFVLWVAWARRASTPYTYPRLWQRGAMSVGPLVAVAAVTHLGQRPLPSSIATVPRDPTVWTVAMVFGVALVSLASALVAARRQAAIRPLGLVAERRDDDALVLAFEHATDDKTAVNPRPVLVPAAGQFGNIHVLGAIGSGKTAAVIKPIIEQVLSKHIADPGRRPAMLLLDIKGGMADDVREIARRYGREDDVCVLRPGGPLTFNVLGSAAPEVEAVRLFEALYANEDEGAHPFYANVAKRFLLATFEALDEQLGRGRYTLFEVSRMLSDPDYFEQMTGTSQRRAVVDLRRHLAVIDERERYALTIGLASKLSLWTSDVFASTFAPVASSFPGFTALIEEGLVCVLELPEDQFNAELCRGVATFLLSLFMDEALQRTNPAVQINRERIVYLIADEAHVLMNARLARFTAVSRQSKTCTVLAHQSLGQIPTRVRGPMMANLRTRLALSINDVETAEYLSREFGVHLRARKTRSESATSGPTGRRSRGASVTELEVPRFSPTALLESAPWRITCSVFDGSGRQAPVVARVSPHFDWER